MSEQVYWASLPERCGAANDEIYNRMLQIAVRAGKSDYRQFTLGYTGTDNARNLLCKMFMEHSSRDNDLLIMMDADHLYPEDILPRMASHDPHLGVVGALAYRRGAPFDPLFFVRDSQGGMRVPAQFDYGDVYTCAIVSTSCIAIRRWVLVELEHKGYGYPWFRYEYPVGSTEGRPSEDMYFGWICEKSGIAHHCDTGIIIPHFRYSWVDRSTFEQHLATHNMATEAVSAQARGG